MPWLRPATLSLLPALLLAQRPPTAPADAFDRELKRNRFGTWLVLEDEGAAWGAAMRAALDEEPMVGLNLPLKVVSGGKRADALALVLRERFGWSKGAHWALVDGKGQLRAEGAEAPASAALGRAVEQAGFASRIQELEAFLRLNPERLDARAVLIREHLAVAGRKTRKALGLANPVPGGAVPPGAPASSTPVPPPPPKPLDPELDLKVWAAAAQHLDILLRESRGLLPGILGFMVNLDLRRSPAEHSPAMVAVLGRHRVDLEEVLRRQPEAAESWQLWVTASQKCGGWPLPPLLASLSPLPGTGRGDWPPAPALEEFIRDEKSKGGWTAIREVLEPRWASLRDDLVDGRRAYASNGTLWDGVVAPLLEAQVAQGDTTAAEQVLGEMADAAPWPGLPASARNLATRLKRPDLAARWGALTPKGR